MVLYFLRQDPFNLFLSLIKIFSFLCLCVSILCNLNSALSTPSPEQSLACKGTLHSLQGADLLLRFCCVCTEATWKLESADLPLPHPALPHLGLCCVGFAVPFNEDPQPLQVSHPMSHCLPYMILNTDKDTTLVF